MAWTVGTIAPLPADATVRTASKASPSETSTTSRGPIPPKRNLEATTYGSLIDLHGEEFQVPDFTIKQIRDAIPAECFQRSTIRGMGYVIRDLILLAVTFSVFNTYVQPSYISSYPVRFILWGVYTFLQGLFATGVWVLAHECGHQSFSPSRWVNDSVGFVLHSALLVPYFSWKISHGKHHKHTGHMERDMVFLPRDRQNFSERFGVAMRDLHEVTEDAPINTLLFVIGRQLVGWPVYLLTNDTGHDSHERQPEGRGRQKRNGFLTGVNHFNPSSPLFENRDAKLILASDVGIAIAATVLFWLGQSYGWKNLAVWYFIPYLWVNNWLVAITYLQHTDPSLPHYYDTTWSFIRGAACTIDRSVPFIGPHLWHGIIETHVLHHYVSTIPFYHAEKATAAIRPVMGKHYKSDTRDGAWGFLRSLFTNARMCQWVESSAEAVGDGKDVVFFRNRRGLGQAKPLSMRD